MYIKLNSQSAYVVATTLAYSRLKTIHRATWHFVREHVNLEKAMPKNIAGVDNPAYVLTKAFDTKCLARLMVL